MLRINLLNNKGLQDEDSFIDLLKIDSSAEQPPIISSEVSKENKQKFDEIKKNLDEKSSSKQKRKKKKKKKNVKPKSVFFVAFILALATAILYLYFFTDVPEIIIEKMSNIKAAVNETKSDSISNITENEIVNEINVGKSIADQIFQQSKDLSLISGVLELLPENVQIIDFNLKNDNLSIICIVQDIISGENIKFFIYNHNNSFKPELFYIEKTEDAKNYQITSLTKILKNNINPNEYKYLNDKQLSGFIASTGENLGLEIEPLTISKRDQTVARQGFVYVSGSKINIINFCRELVSQKINVSYNDLEIKSGEATSGSSIIELKIGITIFPQK